VVSGNSALLRTSQSNKIADLQTLLDVSEHERQALSAAAEAVEKALQASLQEALRGSKSGGGGGGGGGGGTAGGVDTSALEREVAELRQLLEHELEERAVAALEAKNVRERDAESIRDLRERITRMEASSRGSGSGSGGGDERSVAGGASVARCTCTCTPTHRRAHTHAWRVLAHPASANPKP
jgi:hypothetical protein